METVNPIKDRKKIEEIKALMRYGRQWKHLLMFTLGINSGLRISDILKLKFSDILYDDLTIKQSIKIREKKTGKEKSFPVNKKTIESIKALMKNICFVPKMEWYIFTSNVSCRPYHRTSAWKILNRYARGVGLRYNVGTHTLRKTFGYHCYNSGVNVAMIMKLLNHGNQDHTLRYIGITRDEMDKVYNDINL